MIKFLRIALIIIKNAYVRDSKIFGFVFTNLLFQLVEIAVTVIFFRVIFDHTESLAGWSFHQVLFLYMFAKFTFSLHKALFRGGFNQLAGMMIRHGDYDFYLTKPVNSLLLASLSKPRIYEFIAIMFEVGIAVWAIYAGHLTVGMAGIAWFIFLAALTQILIFSLAVITVCPVFWLVKVWALRDIIMRMQAFMRYPVGVFPVYLQVILMGVFPIMAASYIPVKTLFYPPEIRYILYMFLITIIFVLVARWLWRLGERNYGSASS